MRVFFGLFTAVAICYGGYVLVDMEYGRRLSSIYLPISVATFLLWFIVSFIRAIRANKRDQALRAAGEETSSGPSGKRILINVFLVALFILGAIAIMDPLFGTIGTDAISAGLTVAGVASVALYFARYGQPLTGADRFRYDPFEVLDRHRQDEVDRGPYYAHLSSGGYYEPDR